MKCGSPRDRNHRRVRSSTSGAGTGPVCWSGRRGRGIFTAVDGVESWLGIPYAHAVRFARPEPVPWDGDLERHGALGPSAPQRPGGDVVPGMAVGPTDERACLSLNVW